jgi:hypothetical protein
MSNNALRTPLVQSLHTFALQKVQDQLQLTGKALPCHVVAVSGGIVTVAFDVVSAYTLSEVTLPVAGSIYLREPIQVGDLGVVFSADVSLGGINGLGTGTPTLAQRANLSSLVFQPVANKGWGGLVDSGKVQVQGPTGAVIQDLDGNCVFTLSSTGITITIGGVVVWDITLTENNITGATLNSNSPIISQGIPLATHLHVDAGGTGDSGPPIP